MAGAPTLVRGWTCKKCSHLRLLFSMGLVVCSTDIPFPHFTGFLYAFLFYPRLYNHWESLILEHILGMWVIPYGPSSTLLLISLLFSLLPYFHHEATATYDKDIETCCIFLPLWAPPFLCGTFPWTINRAISSSWKCLCSLQISASMHQALLGSGQNNLYNQVWALLIPEFWWVWVLLDT